MVVTEVASLREGEWSCYGGCYFSGRENGHVTGGHFNAGRRDINGLMEVVMEVASLKEGEWSCYRGQFNGEQWSCY